MLTSDSNILHNVRGVSIEFKSEPALEQWPEPYHFNLQKKNAITVDIFQMSKKEDDWRDLQQACFFFNQIFLLQMRLMELFWVILHHSKLNEAVTKKS